MAKKAELRPVNNNILNVITPMAIEFNPSYFYFGENLAKVILVMKYPPHVNIGWLSRIANMEGVTCSIHMNPADPSDLIDNIAKSMGELPSKIKSGGNAVTIDRAENQYKQAKALLRRIDQNQESVWYVTIAIMVMASEKEELDRKCKRVESALSGSGMRGRAAMFRQEDALNVVSPYGLCPQSIRDMSDRNMPISTIAGSFPFSASGLNDGTGFIFGKDNDGGIILLDIWRRGGDRTNCNWTLLGAPGVGKSTAVKHIMVNEYAMGTVTIFIDPEREYKEMCEKLGGQWINCGGGAGGRINPLQIKVVPLDDEDKKDEDNVFRDEGKGMGSLALHFQTLRTFFKLYLRDLTSEDYADLEECLEELYFERGIRYDTDVSNISNSQYPLLSDLQDLIVKKSIQEDITEKQKDIFIKLAKLLRSCAKGADAALWNGHTTVEAKSNFIVLDTYDLQDADETIKRTQYFNILTWAWHQLSRNREEKVLLGVDEAYLLVDPEVPQALQFLRNVSKRIRKYMGGLAVISHSAVDFLDPSVRRHGQALLDNPCFKFFMGTDGKDLEELTKLMKLTEAEQEMLEKKQRGHGLLIAGSKRLHGVVEISDFELELFGKGGGK